MKVLLSWLREFAPIQGDPVALGETMSDLGMAVESLDRLGEGLDGVVVARVLDLRPHPDADRIQLVDVDAGDGEPLQIACGAFNMAVGDLVPLATIGTTLPNGLTIARRKLRGEYSNGMLCAPDEIGLGSDHEGILVLADDLEVGAPVADALGLVGDVLYDLEINPNRPDAMSVAGVARDLAARLGVPFAIPQPAGSQDATAVDERASVDIVDPDLCGRFLVRVVEGVEIGSSPDWLARRLVALGMRPINSVVDVSNYVMLELGQPNHTYDLALVPDGRLGTRWARPGETLVTLDGVERSVGASDGVIVDCDDRPIGLAGVMGGASTEISADTTGVLLEMAWWNPMAVARTSSRLGLRSEASMRFERGTDPDLLDLAARRFVELLGDGTRAGPPVVADGDLPDRAPIRLRTARMNALLGTTLEPEQITDLLEPIGFTVEANGDDLDVVVPTFRPDTRIEVDVVEEIARHHGYSRIPRRVPRAAGSGGLDERQRFRRQVRQVLAGLGATEAMPLPFLAPDDLVRAALDPDAVTITNPLDATESVLRPSLRPGLLKAVAYNESHRNTGVCLFEIGRVFRRPADPGSTLPDEPEQVGVVLAGADATEAARTWQVLARGLGIEDVVLVAADAPGLHPTRTAELHQRDLVLGLVGEIDPDVLDAFDVTERVGWVELDLDRLAAASGRDRPYREISRYPSSDIDLAFEVADDVTADAVAATIRRAAGDLLVDLGLFDVFRGDAVGEGRRSLAYRLRLQAGDRTLTDGETADCRLAIIEAVERDLGARLR